MLRKAGLVLVCAAVVVPAVGASPAAAQTCTFSGLSGQLVPPVPPLLGGLGQIGTLNPAGETQCVPGGGGSFSGSGSYENTLCGSGLWRGSWSGSLNGTYRIEFAHGNGLLYMPEDSPVPSGSVSIHPENANGCSTEPVDQFVFDGVVALTGPPPPILPPGTREASADCASPTVDVIETPVAGGYLRLRVKQAGTAVWVCVRVAASSGTYVGGKLVFTPPSQGGGGTPGVDANSGLCGTTPGNQAPGPHPIAGPGTVAGQHVMLDTWSSSGGETWICAEVGTTKTRVKIATPGVSPGSVTFERDV